MQKLYSWIFYNGVQAEHSAIQSKTVLDIVFGQLYDYDYELQ